MKTKKELRNEILKRRDVLSCEERRDKSHRIAMQVCQRREFEVADRILLFASCKSEVDTTEIFETAQKLGKDIYYPKVNGIEMEFYQVQQEIELIEGYRGIREPEALEEKRFVPKKEEKICIIMPGAVFDGAGNRIGYGGGYYDKYLQKLEDIMRREDGVFEGTVCKLAVAFQCQMIGTGQIVSEKYDVKPDYIVTENQLIKIKTPAHTNGKS